MSKPAYIPIEELREGGYVQEANRQFFHPLGLALEVREGFTKESILEFLTQHGIRFGDDAIDCVWTFVHTIGMDKWHLSGVWDDRDDPEGIVYAIGPNGINPIDRDKALKVVGEMTAKAKVRNERFGWMIQPMDSELRAEDLA